VLSGGSQASRGGHPYALGAGINLNTASPHVLALIFSDDGVDLRLAQEETIRAILEVRTYEPTVSWAAQTTLTPWASMSDSSTRNCSSDLPSEPMVGCPSAVRRAR